MLQHITKLWSLQLLVIAVQRGGGIGKSWVGINSGPGTGPTRIQQFLEFYTFHNILYLPLHVLSYGQSTFLVTMSHTMFIPIS